METVVAVTLVCLTVIIVATVCAWIFAPRKTRDDVMAQVIGDAPHMEDGR